MKIVFDQIDRNRVAYMIAVHGNEVSEELINKVLMELEKDWLWDLHQASIPLEYAMSKIREFAV